MSREHARGSQAGDGHSADRNALRRAVDRLASVEGARAAQLLGGLAAATVAVQTLFRVARNVPGSGIAAPPLLRAGIAVAAPLAMAAAALAVAFVTDRTATRIGLLFLGSFGPLALLSPAAALPAALGITVGGALAVADTVAATDGRTSGRRALVGLGICTGVVASVAAVTGVVPASIRGIGAALTLSGVALLGIDAGVGRWDRAIGLVAAGGVLAAGFAAPTVASGVLLAGFGVLRAPVLLVALAAGGAMAALGAALRRRLFDRLAGVSLLIVAGAPVTVPRTSAVLLGATIALAGPGIATTAVREGSR